jgi:hypothetical protein
MKRKHLLISLLVIVLMVLLFLSTSCDGIGGLLKEIGFGRDEIPFEILDESVLENEGEPLDETQEAEKEYQQEVKKSEETAQALEAASEAELLEGFEEEEELIPDEPITYSGDALGLDVVLIVNFKTTTVTGSINLSGDPYVDATITDGEIDIDTFEIIANFSGVVGAAEYGEEEPFNGIITGIISEDYSTFKGVILDDEGGGGKFTLTK